MFEKCVNCPRLGRDCYPPLYRLHVDEMAVFVHKLMAAKGLKNVDLSESSGIKEGTIRNFLTGTRDIMYSNITAILISVLGGSETEYYCRIEIDDYAHYAEEINRLKTENEELKGKNISDVQFIKKAIKTKNIAIIILGTLLFVVLSLIIATLLIDRIKPDLGFIWRQ